MSISSYYGNSKWRTFLDYGEVSENGLKRTIQRQFFDQVAYDHHHLALYIKDYMACRLALDKSPIEFEDIPRIDKNLLGFLFLCEFPEIGEITELGSSLFEVIDGFEVASYFLQSEAEIRLQGEDKVNSLQGKTFSGIEISESFRNLARVLHPDYDLKQFADYNSFMESFSSKQKLLLDRSVANYMFESGSEFGEFVRKFEFGLLNTYFSLEEDFSVTRYGKQMNYLSLKDFLDKLERPFFHLYGHEAPRPLDGSQLARGRDVVEGFFILMSEEQAKRLMKSVQSIKELHQFLDNRSYKLLPARTLINGK